MQGIVIGVMILIIKTRLSFTGCACTIPAKTVCEQQADEFRLFTSLFPLIPFRSSQKGSQGYPQEKNPEDFVSDMTAKADGLTEERAELLKSGSVGGFFQEGTCGTGCTPDCLS